MAKHSFFGGLFTFSAAAAVAAGACYFFKDQIRGTKTYQNLNEKYDVDSKVSKATETAKTKAAELKTKAVDLKNKAMDSMKKDEDDFDNDEIILDEEAEISRDYVPLADDEEAAEAPADKAEEAAEAVADKAEEAAEAVADKAEEAKDAATDAVEAAADKLDVVLD